MNRFRKITLCGVLLIWLLPSWVAASLDDEVQRILTESFKVKGQYPHMHCFQEAARQHNLPLPLLLAVAKGESNFNPKAVSHKNAVGVMQILWPETAKHLNIHSKAQLYDPCTNIQAGAKYLAELLQRYKGNLYRTLAAYNYGPGRIDQRAKIPAGAKGYVNYIYDKYLALRPVTLEPVEMVSKRLVLRPFIYRFYYYAKRSKADLARRATLEGVTYDVEKDGQGLYQVVAYYDGTPPLRQQIARRLYEVTGFEVE